MSRLQPCPIGARFGKLVITGEESIRVSYPSITRLVRYWHWVCDCGTTGASQSKHIKAGATISCGCMMALRAKQNRKKFIGKVYAPGSRRGRLEILGPAEGDGNPQRCRCDCGTEVTVPARVLRTKSASCGPQCRLRPLPRPAPPPAKPRAPATPRPTRQEVLAAKAERVRTFVTTAEKHVIPLLARFGQPVTSAEIRASLPPGTVRPEHLSLVLSVLRSKGKVVRHRGAHGSTWSLAPCVVLLEREEAGLRFRVERRPTAISTILQTIVTVTGEGLPRWTTVVARGESVDAAMARGRRALRRAA